MNIGVVVQARASSSRLPGKVLMDVNGQPMLLRQLSRLRNGLDLAALVVATSTDSSDDPVAKLCSGHDFDCFRGPLDDVMARYVMLSKEYGFDSIVRVGGDDPLADPKCCNLLAEMQREHDADFIYASHRAGWPYGTASELIKSETLANIHSKVKDKLYLEHIIPYFFDNPDGYRILKALSPQGLLRPDYCFSVDYEEDFQLIREIFARLSYLGDYFELEDVIKLIDEHPDIRKINSALHTGFDH